MKFTYATAAAILALATAPAAMGQQSTNQATGVFQQLEGGGLKHVNSEFECPATLASFSFQKQTIYREDGSDVGCSYDNASTNSKMDYYIYQRPASETIQDLAIGAARSINQTMEGLELDKQASQECQIGVGTAMMKAGHVNGEATAPPCYVFTKDNLATLVSVWKRGDWNIKVRMTGPDTRITNATAAVYALSHQASGQAVSNTPPPAPTAPPQTKPQDKGLSKAEVDQFCAQSTTKTTPGMQFNGKKASADVMAMAPGRYSYKDNGAMLYFPDNSYIVRLPDNREGIFGTDGDDMLVAGGLLAGCHAEQLSEIFERNKLDFNGFKLVEPR